MKKFAKVLACVLALTMVMGLACAEKILTYGDMVADPADTATNGNLILNIADLLPEGVTVDQVYGARVTFDDASVEVAKTNGAGGGFIFSSDSNNWQQLQWCNGCGDGESHDIQLDGNSITRMETAPFFTEANLAEGAYAQIALCMWWGGDMTITAVELLDADGNVLEAAGAADDGAADDGATDSQPETGDATSIVLLAGVAVLAMVGVVASKKRA